jgi:hypothetical protein
MELFSQPDPFALILMITKLPCLVHGIGAIATNVALSLWLNQSSHGLDATIHFTRALTGLIHESGPWVFTATAGVVTAAPT